MKKMGDSSHSQLVPFKGKLATWPLRYCAMLMMVVQITTQTKRIPLQSPEIFQPVTTHQDPLFQLTQEEKLIQIARGNLSLTIQSYQEGPYLMAEQKLQTEGYKVITNVLDLATLATQAHNSRKFLQSHNQMASYLQQEGFQSKFKTESNTNKEFLLYPGILGFEECELLCPIYQASMPQGYQEIKEAGQILDLGSNHMWISSTQEAWKRKHWSWAHMFQYKIYLDNIPIYPNLIQATSSYTNCTAYKNGVEVQQEDIGFLYHYWQDNKYHQSQPYQLEVSINQQLDCRIIVPYHQQSSNSKLDDATCVCKREKQPHYYEKNKLEAEDLDMELTKMIEDISIEDWRFKTQGTSTSTLDDIGTPQGKLQPRYVTYSATAVNTIKNDYVTNQNLTTLKLNSAKVMTLKPKDVIGSIFTGIAKTAISNPELLTNLHQTIKGYATKNQKATLVPTKDIMGSDDAFASKLNGLTTGYKISRNDSVISVSNTDNQEPDWNALSLSKKGSDAEKGIQEAKKNVLTITNFQQKVFPMILNKILIPRHYLEDVELVLNMDSIIVYNKYGSYVEIKIYIPIKLQDTTTLYSIAPLPFKYDVKTDTHIVKQLPSSLSIHLGKSSYQPQAPQTPCGLDLIKSSKSTKQCKNTAVQYQPVNHLLTIKGYGIYLVKDVGTLSVSCPQSRLQWYDLHKQINVIIIHQSCVMESRGGDYNLVIKPNTTQPPLGMTTTLLLSYNIFQDWIPTKDTRWVLQLTTIIITGLFILFCLSCVLIIAKQKPWVCKVANMANIAKNKKEVMDPVLTYFKDLKEEKTLREEKAMKKEKHSSSEYRPHMSLNLQETTKPHRYHLGYDQYDTDLPISSFDFQEETFIPGEEYTTVIKTKPGTARYNREMPSWEPVCQRDHTKLGASCNTHEIDVHVEPPRLSPVTARI